MTLRLANRWLKNCAINHEECSEGFLSGFMPSRLIDIGLDGAISPKLIETSSMISPQRYLSLSHCWGGKVPLSLCHDSLAGMREEISYGDLPKTFQHALIVTRQLGCRYVWIDSLCIIQDSHEDWVKESDRMRHVYANSFCNIAASAAENSSEGLFFDRYPGSIMPLRISINGSGYLIDPPFAGMHMVDQAPLSRRGWVFQERLLSPRILHFTASQVFWECRSYCACETYPSAYPMGSIPFMSPLRRINPAQDGLRIRRRDGGGIFNTSPDTFLDQFALWNMIIANYSRCSLTQHTDRLVAMSGIAAKFQEVSNDNVNDYLAGMWRKQLPYSLTWQALGKNSRPAAYTAPTWSWASITGLVKRKSLTNSQRQQLVKITAGFVEPAGSNKFGQVNSGFVTLKGSLMAMPLSICQSKELVMPCLGCQENLETISLPFTLDVSRPHIDRVAEARQRLHFPVSWARSLTNVYVDIDLEYPSVYGVPISAHRLGERREVEGLLLEATRNIGEFRRVGTFSYTTWQDMRGGFPDQCLDAFRLFDSQATRLGLTSVPTDHLDYDLWYTIKII